jgi:S-adenosylmethionine-dependent methyltransferase
VLEKLFRTGASTASTNWTNIASFLARRIGCTARHRDIADMSEATKLDRLRAYYASFDEWGRLDSPEGVRELARALEILEEKLAPGSRVLDLGGGPGRYAIELARRGHGVVLADLSPTQLDVARRKVAEADLPIGVESYDQVNATNLSIYADASFDAVVAFGPFYHLISDDERRHAAREIRRVLVPRGRAFIAFVPRLSGLIGLIDRAATKPAQVTVHALRMAAETGAFSNTADSGFQEGYYPEPGEMQRLFELSGFRVDDMVSLKSIANELGAQVAQLDTNLRAEVERIARELCRRREVIATSGHALLIVSPL